MMYGIWRGIFPWPAMGATASWLIL